MDKLDKPGVCDTTGEKEERFCSATEAQEASITGLSADSEGSPFMAGPTVPHTPIRTYTAGKMVQVSGGASCQSSGSQESDRFITTSGERQQKEQKEWPWSKDTVGQIPLAPLL